jgi:hypothetical protein
MRLGQFTTTGWDTHRIIHGEFLCKRVFITNVKGTFFGMSEVGGGIKEALKQLPECHTTQ